MLREPRREEYTICTATAPEAVFTIRTDVRHQMRLRASVSGAHSPGLRPQTCRPKRCTRANPDLVIKVRTEAPTVALTRLSAEMYSKSSRNCGMAGNGIN